MEHKQTCHRPPTVRQTVFITTSTQRRVFYHKIPKQYNFSGGQTVWIDFVSFLTNWEIVQYVPLYFVCSDPWVLPPGVSENTSMDNVLTINVSNVLISNTIWRKLRFAQTYQGGGWRRWVGIQTVWFETTVHMLFPSNCQYGSFDHDHGLFLTVREYSTSFALQSYNSVSWFRAFFISCILISSQREMHWVVLDSQYNDSITEWAV